MGTNADEARTDGESVEDLPQVYRASPAEDAKQFLLARREAWFANDDGTAASLPAVLSRQIFHRWIGDDGRMVDQLEHYGSPLRLAYAHHGLAFDDPLDKPCNTYPDLEMMSARWSAPVKSPEPVRQSPVKASGRPADLPLVLADLYFIGSEDGPIKIGVSVNPESRLKSLQTGYPYKLRLLAVVPRCGDQERAYHDLFAAHRLHGEWFIRAPEIEAEIERLNASPERGGAPAVAS